MRIISTEPDEHSSEDESLEPGDAAFIMRTDGSWTVMTPRMAPDATLMEGDPFFEVILAASLQDEKNRDLRDALTNRLIVSIESGAHELLLPDTVENKPS
jgi:hypothetical protein